MDQAIKAFHEMSEQQQLKPRGLSERSWLGWEAGDGTSDDYRDRLCRLFKTNGVRLGFGADYTPLLRAGVDISVIAMWLGHETTEATQTYLHADMSIKERALARVALPTTRPGRYTPPDTLLNFLDYL